MASVRQAVLEFDAAVQVPWRPLLTAPDGSRAAGAGRPARGSAATGRGSRAVVVPGPTAAASGATGPAGTGPRVGAHLRPVPDRPSGPESRSAEPATRGAGRAPVRREPARTAGLRSASGRAVRGGCAPSRRVPTPRLRLTRRGRRLLATLALGAAVALGSVLAALVGGADEGGLRLVGEQSVVVEPGDTVWSIAGEVAGPDRDVRTVVDAIEELNDLEGSVLAPGQVLELP